MTTPSLPAPPSLETIENPALFLDFDGTLVEIADAPDGISVPADLRTRIEALSRRFEGRVALVSGRSPSDLRSHLGPIVVAIAGSHGAAVEDADGNSIGEDAKTLPEEATAALRDYADKEGLLFENKPHGAGLHFRSHPEREEAAARFTEALAEKHGLGVKRGKQVNELIATDADKGRAVRQLLDMKAFAGAVPIFLGDDVTDEDGFVACTQAGGFGIAVGERTSQNARHALADVAAVYEWLSL